jgi:queuine tRNA-ribosyltransferase
MLLTWHNLHYYQELMRALREAVAAGGLATVSAELRDGLAAGDMPPTGLGTTVR